MMSPTRACLVLLLCAGCGGELPEPVTSLSVPPAPIPDIEAPTVRALYRAATHEVPLPNDLYRGSLVLAVPAEAARNEAEADIFARLSGASGYFADCAVSFPLSGPLDASTVEGASIMFNPDTQAVVPHRFELSTNAVTLVPDAPLAPGARVVAALWAGPTGPAGQPFLRDEEYAAYAAGRGSDHTPAAEHDVTFALDAILSRGLAPDDVVVSTVYTVSDDEPYPFDPTSWTVPFPSGHHATADGLAIPGSVYAVGFADVLADYRGFSTQSPVTFPFPGDVLNNAPLHNAMSLFVLDDAGLLAIDDVTTSVFDGDQGAITPDRALPPASEVVGTLVRGPTADGRTFDPGLPILAVTSAVPLVDAEGRSLVRILDDQRAASFEVARPALSEAALFAADHNVFRDDLLAITRFSTVDARAEAESMRQALYDADTDPTPLDIVVATPEERGLPFILSDIDTIVTGAVTTLDFVSDPGTAVENPIEFILNIPDGHDDGSPMPVVLFGHGLFTTRELVYLAADFLAAAGFASLCVDFPFHGQRAVCVSSADCQGDAMCEADQQCHHPDGTLGDLVTVASPVPGGPAVPLSTGGRFIDLDHPANTRDNFLQGLVDLSQAVRLIRDNDWPAATGYDLDGDDIVYLGMSLGGIYGASFSAIEEHIQDFALNVPGAGLVDLMQESEALRDEIQDFAGQTGTLPGTDAYFAYVHSARWILDVSDPLNIVRPHPGKRYLLQMANGDQMVSNAATQRLADALGEPISDYSPLLTGHAFMFDPTSLQGEAARDEIVAFFESRAMP